MASAKENPIDFFFFITLANLGFGLIGKPVMQIMFGADFVPVYYVYFWLMPARLMDLVLVLYLIII